VESHEWRNNNAPILGLEETVDRLPEWNNESPNEEYSNDTTALTLFFAEWSLSCLLGSLRRNPPT
jgi:hypothetical protein